MTIDHQPPADATVPHLEPARRRRRAPWWSWLAAALAAAAAVTGVALAFTAGGDTPGIPKAAAPARTQLWLVYDKCLAGNLSDGDHTLVVDMAGEEYGSGTATVDDLACVIDALDTPQSVLSRMESTRALDGMQSAAWDGFEATWTYHPDDGLDLIVTETEK